MEKVAIKSCQTYALETLEQALRNGLNAIDFDLLQNKKVLIKPNLMSQNKPQQHSITHYALVEALCRMLNEKNCEVFIGDSIAFYEKGLTQKAFETSGLAETSRKTGAHLVAFEGQPLKKFTVPMAGLQELYIPAILFEMDMVINVCKLKTHGTMRLSGAIKNLFGCLPGGYKQLIHQWMQNEFELAAVFIKLHQLIQPALSIMDAVVSLDGGPTALGQKIKTGCLLFSTNPAALDFAAARMIGYQPDRLPILLEAQKQGLIEDYQSVEICGDVQRFSFKKLVAKELNRPLDPDSLFVKHTYADLFISKTRCTQCGDCQNFCPVNAISLIDNRLRLNNDTCLHCYGCFLNCPHKAVLIRIKPLNLALRSIRKIIRI